MAEDHPQDEIEQEAESTSEEVEAPVADLIEADTGDSLPAESAESESPEAVADEADEAPADEADDTPADEASEDEDADEASEDEDAEESVPEIGAFIDDGIKRRWYAIHAYSGQEGSVKKNLLLHAEQGGLKDVIADVLVPMEEVAEIKSGEKKISKRKFFPGYVLVRLPEHPERNPELWHLIKETPGVSGFIGSRSVPVPLDDGEVQAIIDEMRGERERPKPKVNFEDGERVKIIDGPFSNFLGNIDDINAERGTLKVMVEIFERLTSVEVEFWQVEKM